MKIKIIFYSIFIGIILTSCDPAKMIIIKADKNSDTYVAIYSNENIKRGHLYSSTSDDSLRINQKVVLKVPEDNVYEKQLTFGLGYWSNRCFELLVNNIDSIVIKKTSARNDYRTVILKDKRKIITFLKKNKINNAAIKIEAK